MSTSRPSTPGAACRASSPPTAAAIPGRPSASPRAINRAAKKPGPEYTHFLVLGTDHALPTNAVIADVLHRASGLEQSTGWAPVWGATEFLGRPATRAVLDGTHDIQDRQLQLQSRYRHCTGPLLIERGLFERVGGYDERFSGWGAEDDAMRLVLADTAGEAVPAPLTAVCRSLWHPRDTEHFDPEVVANNVRLLESIKSDITDRNAIKNEELLDITESDSDGE